MKWLDKVERKIGWFAIPNLMFLLSGMMLAVFLLQYALPEEFIQGYLYLDWNLIRAGQVWRVISFLILPPGSSPFWILFSLYFYCLIGNGLEREWGTARFTLFYLVGYLGSLLGSLFTGYATNQFINLSMFFAFAALYPDFKVMLFFIIPVKIKYLALLDALFYIYLLVTSSWPVRVAILLSLLNIALFFGGDIFRHIKDFFAYRKTRNNFRRYMR